jgi:Ca2+-binding EF-hand superfamily protein
MGREVPLDPHNLVAEAELRDMATDADPDASREAVDEAIRRFYDEFLDRLLVTLCPDRPFPRIYAARIRIWLGDRIPDSTAIARAVDRHAQIFMFEDAESHAPTEHSFRSDGDVEDETMDPEGQTLQRTLYHIAEDRARLEGVIHRGITCNGCDEKPIRGTRWHCANCVDFDLCSNCEASNSHYKNHIFYKIRVPAPHLSLPKQETLYSGKPHMMRPSIDPTLKKSLVSNTNLEAEEIEALWDQFTCLAGTEWTDDASGVGWAMDRRDFNHAFLPRYNSFVAAPNLIYDRIFAYYDTDKNGLIGFEEWIKGLDGMHTTDVDIKARIVFNGYDIDGDGYVSRKDILRIFRAYYAVEREATQNFVSELGEELSVRNAQETIQSSQPLGSAFPPRNMAASHINNPQLQQKQQNEDETTLPVLEHSTDFAEREEMLRITNTYTAGSRRSSDGQQNDLVASRRARSEFYVDEEEGLARPEGTESASLVAQESIEEEEPLASEENTSEELPRNRWSRSSSRVRFQDDVDIETRSNVSTSSRPPGERWGGYEVPEPEKDLGKEVLYQITQQAFNELLDPLFLEKEDMAMDAHETRSERRALASAIETTTNEVFRTAKEDSEAIVQVGVFRYSKCVVELFCKALNNGCPSFRSFFNRTSFGGPRTRKQARWVIERVYDSVEETALRNISVSSAANLDNMTIWNTFLCKHRLKEEILGAVLQCADKMGWLADPAWEEESYRDPTLPQFRPNSLANVETSPQSYFHSSEASSIEESSVLMNEGVAAERNFFAIANSEPQNSHHEQRAPTAEDPVPLATSGTPLEEPLSIEPSAVVSPSELEDRTEDPFIPKWRSYTDNPAFHYLQISHSDDATFITFDRESIVHSDNHYHPEMNPIKPLVRELRQQAMNPKSPLHLIMLASLGTVEQETVERKGSGLVSFDEFADHMRQGKLRFLESWLEWVSI